MTARTSTLYTRQRMWFFGTLSVFVFVAALYTYFLSASVVHVVMRKEINQEIAAASSYVSQLEAEYIEAQHTVSSDIASKHGYHTADEKIFIDRTDTSLVLGGNGNF